FERFVAIEVDPLACDLAVADAVDARELTYELDAALATHGDPAVEAHHRVIGIEDALGFPVDLGPSLLQLRNPVPDRVVALEGPAALRHPGLDHRILSVEATDGIERECVPCVDGAIDELHVRPRQSP